MIIKANFCDAQQTFNGFVETENGIIIDAGKYTTKRANTEYRKGYLLIPMIADLHAHLRWGQPHKEDYVSGGKAALKGGVGVVWDMPNNPKPPDNSEIFMEKQEAARKSPIDIRLYGAVKPGGRPFPETDFYKIYTESVGPKELHFTSPEIIDATLKNFSGKYVAAHCDDYQILQKNKEKPTHKEQRPPEAEYFAAGYMCEFFKKHDIKGRVCHVSTAKTLSAVPYPVTKEVTLHHLLWNTKTIKKLPRAEWIKMNPPLPYPEDHAALINAAKAGKIEYLVSDHAPHTREEKEENNPSGVPWLEFFAPAMAWVSEMHDIPMETLVRMSSFNPSNLMGERRGLMRLRYDSSFVVLNYNKPLKVTADNITSRCGWSPLEGLELPCSVEAVILNDKICDMDSTAL